MLESTFCQLAGLRKHRRSKKSGRAQNQGVWLALVVFLPYPHAVGDTIEGGNQT